MDQSRHPLDEESCHRVYDDILEQLMEADEYNKLRVWSCEVEKRDVYLTAGRLRPRGRRSLCVRQLTWTVTRLFRSSPLATRIGAT